VQLWLRSIGGEGNPLPSQFLLREMKQAKTREKEAALGSCVSERSQIERAPDLGCGWFG